MASPKLEPLALADDERQVLEGWARRRKTAQALALRSRIVLACADGSSVTEAAAGRFHPHFTPASSSWLNLVERWSTELTNRKLRRSAHRSVTELDAGIRRWINERNKDPRPFAWTKTADEILETLAAYCQRIIDTGKPA
jgi:hypothetical protein